MEAFVTLFRKELRRRQASFGTSYLFNLLLLLVAFMAFLILSWHDSWLPQLAVFGVGLFLVGAPFIAAMIAVEVWSYEWKGDHRYLLTALPVSGKTVLGVKNAMVVFDTVSFLAGVKALLIVFAWLEPEALQVWLPDGSMVAGGVVSTFVHFTLAATLIALTVSLLVQFAWMVGALLPRFHVYVGLVAIVAGGWVMLRFASVSGAVLGWLPSVEWWMMGPVSMVEANDDFISATLTWQPQVVEMGLAPLVAMALAGMLLFLVAAHLFEAKLET